MGLEIVGRYRPIGNRCSDNCRSAVFRRLPSVSHVRRRLSSFVKKLLDEGYAVRGTVRSAAKGVYLSKIFAEYGDRFEQVVVEDITKVSAHTPHALILF